MWISAHGKHMVIYVQEITSSMSFTPIGLLDMYNCSGAVDQFDVQLSSDEKTEHCNGEVPAEKRPQSPIVMKLKVRGCGRFGAYSSQRPSKCTVDGVVTDFQYDSETGLLITILPVPQEEMYRWSVEVQV